MKTKVIFLLAALLTLSTGMEAQNWKKNKHRKAYKVEKRYNNHHHVVVSKPVHVRIVRPQIGMIVPELPHYRKVRYKGRTYYAYQNYLYSRVKTPYGINFRVDIRL